MQTTGVADKRGKLGDDPFDVQVARGPVLVRFRGRLAPTLGTDVDELRAAVVSGDPAAVQLLVACDRTPSGEER